MIESDRGKNQNYFIDLKLKVSCNKKRLIYVLKRLVLLTFAYQSFNIVQDGKSYFAISIPRVQI